MVAAPSYTPANSLSVWGPSSRPHHAFAFSLTTGVLRGVRWGLTAVLGCLFPVIRDAGHLCIFSGKISIQAFCSFLIELFVFMGCPWWLRWSRIRLQCRRPWFNSSVGKVPWRRHRLPAPVFLGFPGGSAGKEFACNAEDPGSIHGSGRSAGKGTGYPLQHSWVSLVAQLVKNLPARWETWV